MVLFEINIKIYCLLHNSFWQKKYHYIGFNLPAVHRRQRQSQAKKQASLILNRKLRSHDRRGFSLHLLTPQISSLDY